MDVSFPGTRATGAQHRHRATTARSTRVGLLILEGLVAVTAVAGGVALILGSLRPELATVLNPPADYLAGTPFSSYLVPGLILAVVVGGVHALAFVLALRQSEWILMGAGVAGTALLIWVFVQMVFIPFSFLQVLYFGFGLAEVAVVMLALGILRVAPPVRPH
ncbi:hypothetical protein [Microbacterium pumilum]|uniref:Uncharacterized protein n=1 Tax=Microbacterium pumilum TaxID=344165 RepID=A0ABN2RSW1_9MICO